MPSYMCKIDNGATAAHLSVWRPAQHNYCGRVTPNPQQWREVKFVFWSREGSLWQTSVSKWKSILSLTIVLQALTCLPPSSSTCSRVHRCLWKESVWPRVCSVVHHGPLSHCQSQHTYQNVTGTGFGNTSVMSWASGCQNNNSLSKSCFLSVKGWQTPSLPSEASFLLSPSQVSPSQFSTLAAAWSKKKVQLRAWADVHHSCKRRCQGGTSSQGGSLIHSDMTVVKNKTNRHRSTYEQSWDKKWKKSHIFGLIVKKKKHTERIN